MWMIFSGGLWKIAVSSHAIYVSIIVVLNFQTASQLKVGQNLYITHDPLLTIFGTQIHFRLKLKISAQTCLQHKKTRRLGILENFSE